MSNSALVSFTKISPNKTSPRNHKIDTVTVHCVVGQLSVETMGKMFEQPSYEASANYGIGSDGRIGQFVKEEDRSWCSSNKENDHRAITIECASDKTHPYAVNDKVYASLINLLVDICQRNGIDALRWQADKSLIGQPKKQNMTAHRWFAAKECPGDYLYSRFGQIAAEVNARLGSGEAVQPEEPKYYYVRTAWGNKESQLGAYVVFENAISACPAGYKVYDWDGNEVYANAAVTTGTQTAEFANLTEEQAAARLLEICRPIAVSYGLFSSVCAAQTILESGYCKTELARKANNVCGMKCTLSGNTWDGSTWDGVSKVNIRTPEQDSAGNTYYIYADFRKYPCIEDSISDRCAYLLGAKNGDDLRYDGIKDCKDYREQITLIKNGGYATDVNYVSKICNIIQRFDLDIYDAQMAEGAPAEQYYVRKTWADADSQLGAYEELQNAQKAVNANWQYNVYDATGKELYNGRKALIDRAVDWAVGIANDNSHGYTNGKWGPEYSCISLIMEAFTAAGLDLGKCNIDKLPNRLIDRGFEDVTAEVDLATGQGLAKGDIMWYINPDNHGHTEMYIGSGQMVGARGDTDGKPGDSKGDEISVAAYQDLGWQRVFRLPAGYTSEEQETEEPAEPADAIYRIQAGAYSKEANAKATCSRIIAAGFDAFVRLEGGLYKIQAGAYSSRENAEQQVAALKGAGFEAIIKSDSALYVVQTGIFDKKSNAEKLEAKLKAAGFDALTEEIGGKYRVRAGVFKLEANAKKLVKRLKSSGFDAIIK